MYNKLFYILLQNILTEYRKKYSISKPLNIKDVAITGFQSLTVLLEPLETKPSIEELDFLQDYLTNVINPQQLGIEVEVYTTITSTNEILILLTA